MRIVHLVGTGPGDPGLLTLRAARLLAAADAVVLDERVPDSVIAMAREKAELHRVAAGEPEAALRLLSELAGSMEVVVRLYAGDPFLLNSGAADAAALHEVGIEVDVVPGVARALGAAVCAGVALPMAGDGAVTVSGVEAARISERAAALAEGDVLLVEGSTAEFRQMAGDPGSEAAADLPGTLVTHPATARQRVVTGPLHRMVGEAGSGAGAAGEAVLIVGEAAARAPRLTWYEQRPLFGRRIVVTRPREQAAEFVTRLEELGAEVVPFATIRIIDPPDPDALRAAVQKADGFHWIVFTSVNGVRRFWEELRASGRDTRALAGVSLCAIGPATAAAIALQGAAADLVPAEHVAEAVVEALTEQGELNGARILLPRAEDARSVLPEALRELGAEVTDVAAYSTVADVAETERIRRMLDAGEIDLLTFTASSTVRSYVRAVGVEIGSAEVACIGPITSATAREMGMDVAVEAGDYTIPGLTAAIVKHYVGDPG